MALQLTMAFSENPRVHPLVEGSVRTQGIDLSFVTLPPGDLFFRNLKYDEFDASEMSISETLLARERSDGSRWDWSALPVFLTKALVWLNLYVNTSSGIETLADFKGRRVGVPDYDMTAALWMRAVLKELHSVEARDIQWYNGRTREHSHGGALGLDHDPPAGIELRWLTQDQTLDAMLDRGELDAAFWTPPRGPRTQHGPSVDRSGGIQTVGNPRIRPLFPDQGRQVIAQYYQKTGIIPTNHLVIVQNRVLREHPWVALSLFEAFQRSKEMAYQRARDAASAYLLFEGRDAANQRVSLGDDPYPLGIRANRNMLERLIRGSLEQGLIRKPAAIEDIFYRTLMDT